MKKVYIETNGCAVVRHDTQRYSKFFRLNGWDEIDSARDADFVLMTTCAVVESTEKYALESILRIKSEMKKDAQFVVSGCLPKVNSLKLNEIFKGVTFSSREENILNDLIDAKIKIDDVYFDGDIQREHSFGDPEIKYTQNELDQLSLTQILTNKFNDTSFIEIYNYLTRGKHFWKEQDLFEVKVAEGCLYRCSYCGTKNARGNLKSRLPEKILSEFKFGAEKYSKILLTGDEVGEYGVDLGLTLVDLLDQLIPNHPKTRVALRYVSPSSLIRYHAKLTNYFESGNVYFICSPFQSGSSSILKLMNRSADIRPFVSVVKDISKNFPNVYKHTQMIVGFPQETEEDFECSLDVLKQCKFDYVTITGYSDRPNTEASKLDHKLKQEVIDLRCEQAHKLVAEIREQNFWEKMKRKLLETIKTEK